MKNSDGANELARLRLLRNSWKCRRCIKRKRGSGSGNFGGLNFKKELFLKVLLFCSNGWTHLKEF